MRALESEVELALKRCPKLRAVNLSISTSKQMIGSKFAVKMSEEDVIKNMYAATKRAKDWESNL